MFIACKLLSPIFLNREDVKERTNATKNWLGRLCVKFEVSNDEHDHRCQGECFGMLENNVGNKTNILLWEMPWIHVLKTALNSSISVGHNISL
jgi:hypothetical protein